MLRAVRQGRGRGDLTLGWQDPSPRARARSLAGNPAAQPGYGVAPVSFGRIVFRLVLAAIVGTLGFIAARAGLAAWHGHASGFDVALAVAAGIVIGLLAWKYVTNRPASHGLSARVRDGGGWGARGDDGLQTLVVADILTDVVEGVVDIAGDIVDL